ncbi:ABC transporter permease [Amycolatopsis sp. NPDC003865]
MSGAFTGTGALVRLALRRDRVRLPVWIAVFAATAASSAAATMAVYPTDADLRAAAASINGVPSLRALYGPVHEATLGATSVFKLTAFGAALAGLLMIFTAVRHTRAEEEAGRRELLGATVVGRYAGLAAGLAVTAGASVSLGVVTAAALAATGLPVSGSLAFGLCWTAAGLVFGAAAAVTAQLTRSARSASGLAVLALVVAYLLRAVGDSSGPGRLTWTSPIGWSEEVRPYAGDVWWVLVLPAGTAALLGGLAIALARLRDLGAGLLPDHPGPAGAGKSLRSPWALAWRLNRGTLAVWASAYVLLGMVCGSLAGTVGSMLTNAQAQAMITALGGEKGISDAFLAAELAMAGVITSTYVIAVLARLHAEERALRVEPLLAAAVDRRRLLGGYLVFAAVAPAVLLAALGLAAGLTNGAHTGRVGPEVARLTGAALGQLPAVWVLTGIATVVAGLFGRALTAAWIALVAFLLLGEFGALLKLDQWVLDLSPFTHSPKLPGSVLHAAPLLWLTALGAALVAAGVAGFRRRDIAG